MNMSRVPSQQRPVKKSLTRGMVVLIIVVVIGVSGLGIGLGFYFLNAQPAGDNTQPPPPPANTIVIGNTVVNGYFSARAFQQSFAMPETTETTLKLLQIKIRVGEVINYQPASTITFLIRDAAHPSARDPLTGLGHVAMGNLDFTNLVAIQYDDFIANPWFTYNLKDNLGNNGIDLEVSRSTPNPIDANRYTLWLWTSGGVFTLGVSSVDDKYVDGKMSLIYGAGAVQDENAGIAPWYTYNSAGFWYFPSPASASNHITECVTDLAFQLVFASPTA